jgi:hypothetical protein
MWAIIGDTIIVERAAIVYSHNQLLLSYDNWVIVM